MFTITRITAAIAVIAVSIAASTSLAGPPAKGETVTLTLANPEGQGRPASLIAERFARNVAKRSKGTIKVRIVYEAGRTNEDTRTAALEANLVRIVRTGKAQLAIIPNRAFRASGVTSFQALQTPFLISTDSQMAAVTTGPIAMKLQSGLESIGLTGLGLVPEGLRRPFGFAKPLLTPADFKGIKIRAIASTATYDLIRALGATPVDLNGSDFGNAVSTGRVKGAESSLAIAASGLPTAGYTAGNIAFFPKIDALVANAGALGKLTATQQEILRRAASETRSITLTTESELRAAAAYCKGGGTIVVAPKPALAALRASTAVLKRRMMSDDRTRTLIAAISGLPAGSASSIPACGRLPKPSALPEPSAGPSGPATTLPPSGDYRRTLTAEAMRAAGADEDNVRNNSGTHTWMFRGSKVTHAGKNPQHSYSCDGAMSVAGPLVRVLFSCDGGVGYFSWRRVGRDVMLKNFDNNKRPFTGWDTLYNGLWTRAG